MMQPVVLSGQNTRAAGPRRASPSRPDFGSISAPHVLTKRSSTVRVHRRNTDVIPTRYRKGFFDV